MPGAARVICAIPVACRCTAPRPPVRQLGTVGTPAGGTDAVAIHREARGRVIRLDRLQDLDEGCRGGLRHGVRHGRVRLSLLDG